MAYGYRIKNRKEKRISSNKGLASQSKVRQLDPGLILASLAVAAGIFVYPFGAEATTITPKDAADAAKIQQIDGVYNIEPQKVNGDFAYNRFSAFILDAGNIANLNFNSASTLANLVNSRIDINGTVNAIRNNAIGGNLYFLSPDGIAVGATGVINAGQFTGIVPTRTAFDTLYNSNNPDVDITLSAINTIKNGSYANDKTIDVEGKINTNSGVMLGAGIINIKDGAKIQSTKDLNFTNLVNIEGGASAGLTNLTASQGTGGDIILTAKQESAVRDTKPVLGNDGNPVMENGKEKTEANAIRWSDRSTDLSAAVNIGKGVTITNSDMAVKITAESTSTYEDSTPMTLTNTLKDVILGEDKTFLDGAINKLAGKEAETNKYLFVNYSGKKNKASVNIGENSSVTGNNIEIAAASTLDIKQSIAVPAGEGKKDSEGKTVPGGSKVAAAVAISRVYNNADVVIDGSLSAVGADAETGDGIKISANADTKASIAATGNGGDANAVAVGVAVLTGDTKAKVTVNEGAAALTADSGKVSVDATTKSDVDVTANVVGNTSYVVSNVGVANYDTSADVVINSSITAGAVDIKADNRIDGLKMTVDNKAQESPSSDEGKGAQETSDADKQQDDAAASAEKNKSDAGKSEDEKKSEKKSIDHTKVVKDASVDTKNDDKTKDAAGEDGKGGVQDVKDKVEGTNEGGDNAKQNSAFGLGTAVGIVSNTNNANAVIGKNAEIKAVKDDNAAAADGSVNVSTRTIMQGTAEKEDSFSFSVKNTQADANAEIGAAVLVSNVKNNAAILLDNEGEKSAQITGGAISIDASAGMGKYKVNQPKKDENGNDLQQTEEVDKTSIMSYTVSAEGTAEDDSPSKFVLDGSVGINTLKNDAVVLLGQKSKVDGSTIKLSSDATTNAEGTYGATDSNTKIGLGGTAGIQNISGNSLVATGKDTSIKGTESFEASSGNSMDLKNNVQNAGKGDSIGISGMVALSYGDSSSIVSLDDESGITAGFTTISASNSTNVENSARSESTGQNGAKAFGIGVGIVNYDVNSIAMVSDNGSGISAPTGNTTDAEKAAKKIYEDAALARKNAGDNAGKLGSKTAGDAKGSITTGGLIGTAITTGMIQNDAKAKVVSASSDDGNENDRKDSEKWSKWSGKGKEDAKEAKTNTENMEKDNVTSQNNSDAPNATGAMGEAGKAADPDGNSNAADGGAAPAANSRESAGASIGIEGSVALTFLGGRTDAVLDNVTVKNGTEAEPEPVAAVSLSATDFLGSVTLGGTNIKNSLKGDSATKVGIGGTFAMNSLNRDVDSIIRKTELPMALMVSNSATKIGIEAAAGMGVSTSEGNGANINGAGVVYYNKAKQDVHALMIANNVVGASVSNQATNTDFQIAGGLSGIKGSGANTNVGVGGAVAISNLENNLVSGIIGGSYTVFSSVDVEAQKGTTQINGALAGTKGGYGFEGAFAYGSTKNNTHAYVDDVTITGLTGSAVNVKAGEVPVIKTDTQLNEEKTKIDNKIDSSIDSNPNANNNNTYIQLDDGTKTKAKTELKKQADDALVKETETQKKNKETLENTGIDTTGESYLDKESAASSLDEDVIKDSEGNKTDEGKIAGDAAKDEDDAKDELGKNHSLTITAAMGGGWNGNVGAGAGIAYNYVKNDIAAEIKESTVTADTVNGDAASDSTIVSVGAGIAIGGKTFNGAGSGSWNDLKNDVKVNFEKNTITGKNISEKADNTASIINIAGEVAGGKGTAMGLSLAYNSLNNTTGAYLKGNDITLSGTDNSVNLAASNKGTTLAVAGGVDVNISQSVVGAVGTAAINRGVSNTESVIDGKKNGNTITNTKLGNVNELSVTASELTKKTTVAGGVSVGSKKVGVGGSVAYTSVGTSGDKERLRAEVNHADITTTENGKIEVAVTDSQKNANNELEKSRVITVGAGFGVDWGKNFFNLQGGAAVSGIYKDSVAALDNTSINANNENAHPTIDVTADTRSKINTVGVGGSVDIGTQVEGAAGVAINRIYQDTNAEMATDNGTTVVNAGLTDVRATGDADIHSVGVGGLVGISGQVAFAGSGSYNYIGNNVDATIKNQKLKSNSSVGVVAQSDDRLYNFAGGFAIGANTKAGIGAAVSINKITGSTNALVSGGSLTATDAGSIKVTRPQDGKLFTTESLDLITDRTKLSESREEETKTGIVVDSSATHTLISQLSSGGVAVSASVGVNLDGTVNLNSIQGENGKTSSTTAKIQDTDINSEGNASNVNVNAVDYANIGSFTGTPSIGAGAALGLSIGVSANWETLDRATEAEISSTNTKKNVYANDLTVDAVAKHGSSALSFAAAAGGGKVGISSGDSIMRHKNTSAISASLNNVNTVFDGKAIIQAEHLGNSHSQNISASASGGVAAVSAGAGVSVMDDASTVKAEVSNSELKAKESTSGKNISVLAKNENNWKETLVTGSLAVGIGAGLAANVGIHNTTGETAALVTDSSLEAYDVTVKAEDKLDAKSIGGVGAGGVGGVGVAVALNNINSSVSAHVTGGSVKASHDINVAAEEKRKFDSQVTGASAGGIGVGVNVAVTSINKGITDAQLSSAKDENDKVTGVNATTQSEINKHLTSVNGAKGSLGASGVKFYGLNATDKSNLEETMNTSVSLSSPTYKTNTPDTRKQGVHTEVGETVLSAGNNVNVAAVDTSDVFARNVGVTAAGSASVNVTDAIIHTNYDTDVTMNKASITGKTVNISALQTQAAAQDGKQGSDVKVTAVTVGALGGVGVGYAGIVNRGETDVNIANSSIASTGDITVEAKDESKHKSNILSVGVAAANVTTTFASVENKNNVSVTLGETNNISASGNVNIDAKRANTLEAHTQGVGVGGVNVAVNHATIEDGGKDGQRATGIAAAKITGTNGTFTADKFHLGAVNNAVANLSAGNTAVSVLGISTMRGKGVMDMGADVSVAGGTFNTKTAEFASMLGDKNGRTIEGNVKGHNISVGAVAPDTVRLETTATGNVNVSGSTFGENTNLILDNESYVDRKGYIYDVTVGGVAVGNSRAIISGKETLTTTLTGKSGITNKLNSLQVLAYGENTGKAFADAGGGGLVGYIGSHVENNSTNNVTSTLGGKWDVAGEVYLVAGQKDEAKLTASEGHGGIAGVGGTSVDNTINTTTNATVQNNTEITADRTHIGTSNAAVTGAYDDKNEKGVIDAQTYTLKDHFGGVISGNRLRSLLDLTENGTVNIGTGAKITTNDLQEYIAASENNLTNLVQAKGGGAIAVTDAVSDFDIDVHNKVNVGSGAILSNEKAASKEDIILAAYDNQTMKSQVDGTVYAGVVSPIVTKNNIDMNRTNDVTVAGTIESGNNVGLYAGADEKGALSNFKADLKSGAYNYSVISITVPRVNYAISADKGTVNVSGTVRSTKDINAIASGGKEEIVKDESLWNWALGGSSTDKKFLSSSATTGTEIDVEMLKSTVNVTGALIAGTSSPINLTIGGSVADGLTVTADNNQANNRVKAGITEGTFDYANTLGARLAELNKLIAAYDGTQDDTVLASYIAERTRIQREMENQGLVEKDADGNITAYLSSGRPVYYVEIPDIATSGGNINVKSDDFIGTGKLHANSAPSITIENKSDAYLKLNNILMGEQGGQIVYSGFGAHLQDTVIPPGTVDGNKKINEINRNESGSSVARFSEIYGVTNGEAASLKVLNTKTFSDGKTSTISLTSKLAQEIDASDLTAAEKAEYKQAIRDGKLTYTAIPDVEVNGKISNFYGQVEINNASGNIRISGGTQNRPTGVEGNTVKLIAANGSIAQDYKEGIVNINGDPEKYLSDQAAAMKNSLGLSNVTNDNKSKTESYNRGTSTEATGYIAGRDVYVSAANVNVNGLIQSGYKNYTATVTQADLDAAMARPAKKAAVVQNRTMYKVNEGGAKWNDEDKAFDYVAQVYWDPATKQLFVEDIDTAGGKVYLTGRIASTGDGRILAADGAAEITVTNNTALDMNMGNVLNNQREGVITIADTAKNTWTEYKRGQTRTITNLTKHLLDHRNDGDPYASATVINNNGLSVGVGNELTYNVQPNQTYSWVNGKSVETTRTFEHYERRGFWGLVQTADEESLKGWEQSSKPIDTSKAKELGLPEGAVISTQEGSTLAGGQLKLDGSTRLLSSRIFEREHWVTRSGFLGWFKHIHDRWKNGTSTIMLYNYAMNASQDIKIGLIGADVGKIDIKSTNTGGGNINLTGNVANSHNLAALTVDSKGGGIFQNDNTLLKSEIVNLAAKDDIKNIHIASIGTKDANGNVTDNIKLSAISTGKGDIDITAVGGLLNNRSLPGNVEIVELKSQNGNAAFDKNADLGDVTLTANGNITQSGSDITVEGRGITLNSRNGGIGTEDHVIKIAGSDYVYATDRYGAQVNASAKDSIYLTETANGGDMRVGKIESTVGDVKLTVENGGFIDGLPHDDKSGSLDSVDDMVHRWIDAGLIDGEKDTNGNYTYKGAYIEGLEKARDDYKKDIEAAYDTANGGKTQADWQADYADQKNAYQSYLDNKAHYGSLSQSELQELEKNGDKDYLAYKQADKTYSQYGAYETADAFLKDNSVAYIYKQYADANAYLDDDAKYQDLKDKAANPTFEWTKDMMLYAVSDALVNPASGSSTQTDGPANVLGKNVSLTSAKMVGTVSDTVKTITVDDLSNESTRIEKMKELMSVGAADVKAVRENGNLTKFEIKGNMPLGVKASGTLDVQAGGNVSVAGRTNTAGEHSAINVGTINATAAGDVRLYSEKGIYNALDINAENQTNITGHDLLLKGGKESIGETDKPLTVALDGDLTEAQADKNVFIKNLKDNDYLRVGALYAQDTISLTGEKGFLMSNANSGIAESYINAGKKLEFNTNADTGIVGDADNSIRILTDRAPVNIAAKSANILGVKNGTLVLGEIKTKNEFVATSEGNLTVGREAEKDSTGTVVKEAVNGSINAGGNVTLAAAENLTLDGAVAAVDKDLTLKATAGSITQTDKGAITAENVMTVNGKALLLENENNQFNSITVDSGSTAAIDGNVRVKDNSDALTVKINQQTAGDISVENLRESGTLTNDGNLSATGNISLGAKGNLVQAANTIISSGKDTTLTSAGGSVNQDTTAGIEAKNVTVVSANGVDLQGTGNAFDAIAVESSNKNVPMQGSVLVKDNADKLELSVQPVVNGDIKAENTKEDGVLQVTSGLLKADGNENGSNGDISLKSDGSLQTDVKLAAAGDVELISTSGDVAINGDVSTGAAMPSVDENASQFTLTGDYNSLVITAGGEILENTDVKIETPVVKTHSGKGVSLESEKNSFAAFLADASDGSTVIDGSVKVKTNSSSGDDGFFTAGLGASVLGDAEFTNLAKDGSLGILATDTDATIDILGGNGADGNLVLKSQNNVGLLGNASAANDIVIEGKNGDFFGVGRGMTAGNDIRVSAGNAVNYVGTISAENDINIKVTAPDSDDSGIYIGTLTGSGDTSLTAGNEVRFDVQGDGDIVLEGNIVSTAGDSVANISGDGNIRVTGSIESKEQSVSLQTGKGTIVIGTDNTSDEETIKANKNVNIGTELGTITIQGETSTENGDITMKAGKDVYKKGVDEGNFIIRDDGKLISGGGIVLNGRNGDIEITDEISAKKGIAVNIAEQGNVDFGTSVAVTNDVDIFTEKGDITVGHSVTSNGGTISIATGTGNIFIGDNDAEVETVTAKENINIATDLGTVTVIGKTSTEDGDIFIAARGQTGADNLVIAQEGELKSGGSINLEVENGDLHVSDNIKATKDLTAEIAGKGGVYFDTDVTVNGNVNVKTNEGDVEIGHIVTSTGGSIGVQVGTGDVIIGDNGPDVETVTANDNVNVDVDLGRIYINGKTSTKTGDISMSAGADHYVAKFENIVIGLNGLVDSARDVRLTGRNGDLHVTDKIRAQRDLDALVNSDGGVFFEKEAVVTGEGVLAGNYIYSKGITAKNNGEVFHLSTMGPDNSKLIGDEIYIGSLRSEGGTEIPSMWTNRGYLHVDEGLLAANDVLAVDKLHLDNEQTSLAVYGRIPTKDGEQLVYWNNLDMANSKTRSFQLYTNGKVRTHRAVLVDAERNYGKLYGDNLSVVDMMRERVSSKHGRYTFDSELLTEPGRLLREPVSFGMESVDVIIRQQNASDAEIVVE